jgi:hypothetical protein
VTSMQEESFAEDVLDTMSFIASLLMQFVAAHNRCVYEWQTEQLRSQRAERARISRAEKKARSSAAAGTSTPVPAITVEPRSEPTRDRSEEGDDEDEDSFEEYGPGFLYRGCCPPYGYPTLHVTTMPASGDAPDPFPIVFQSNAWRGGRIVMTWNTVTIGGQSYPFQWTKPPSVTISHEGKTFVITC